MIVAQPVHVLADIDHPSIVTSTLLFVTRKDYRYPDSGVNAGQCAAKKAGAYGCKFDANGNPTECGTIAVNDATGVVTVAVIQ